MLEIFVIKMSFFFIYIFLWFDNLNWVSAFTEKLGSQLLFPSYLQIWIMSKSRDITHKSKLLRQVVTSSLEVLKNRENGYISRIVKTLSFLEIEARLDNLSVHLSSDSVILCLGGKIGVIVTLKVITCS